MKKITLATLLLTGVISSSYAQQMLGVSTSNWCGTKNIDLNPANIADSRTRFQLDLVNLNAAVDNNLGTVNFSNAINGLSGDGGIGSIFSITKNKDFNVMAPALDLHIVGLMVSIDSKNSIAITTRLRAMNQFNHFNQDLFSAILDPTAASASNNIGISSQKFNWTLHMWSEIKLTYAREVYNKDGHYLKAGLSLTRLGGIGFLSVKGNNLQGNYYGNQDSLVTTNTDLQFATSIFSSADEASDGLSGLTSQLLGKKGGHGIGGDIGVVYEYRTDDAESTDQSRNKYKVRASAAITDMGSIKYDAVQANVKANGYLIGNEVGDAIQNSTSFNSYMKTHGYSLDTGKGSTKVHMPTSLVIGADYYVASHFYVNATWIKNMANRQNFGNSIYSQLSITPRWDTRHLTVGVPLTYSAMSKSMKAGIGVRLAFLTFGSDDILAVVGAKAYGANVYLGACVPIQKKHKKSHELKSGSTSTGE